MHCSAEVRLSMLKQTLNTCNKGSVSAPSSNLQVTFVLVCIAEIQPVLPKFLPSSFVANQPGAAASEVGCSRVDYFVLKGIRNTELFLSGSSHVHRYVQTKI